MVNAINYWYQKWLAERKKVAELEEQVKTAEDHLETKEVDLEDEIEDAKEQSMRDTAWKIHVMISKGKSIAEIDHYVCGICDF